MGFSRGVQKPVQTAAAHRPTCTNCRTGCCNRCPTAITNHGVTDWSSDFDCACYHEAPDAHAELVEEDNPEFGGSGREDGRWDSMGGQFDW